MLVCLGSLQMSLSHSLLCEVEVLMPPHSSGAVGWREVNYMAHGLPISARSFFRPSLPQLDDDSLEG